MLVTLEQAKDHLRIDTDAADADLTLKIHAASGAVLTYLKGANRFVQAVDADGDPVVDEEGEPVYTEQVIFEVQAATLLMLGYLNKDRDGDGDDQFEPGFLPNPVTALLYPFRTPTLA
ncbi:MAG: phage gp6-like head-tail connector protein [Comamonadaceae bacterium]|nr:MAG: phage gp6-like head-tail connector protein [Comamonadaceae bacterium]